VALDEFFRSSLSGYRQIPVSTIEVFVIDVTVGNFGFEDTLG
jgi:hypothetical protein